MRKEIIFILFLIIIGLFGVKALFHPGFYTSHDGEHQVIRLYHFDQALKDGQIPPRWAGTADNGYGYPLFIFSYQLPWYLGVPLLRLGFSLTDAVKGVFILGFVLSGVVMAAWLREMWGFIPALTGAILYIWAPYRFSNIFVRASLGEATAFIFIPLVFWGIWKCSDKNQWRKGIILGSIGLSGIILSHLMVLIVFALPLIFWAMIQVRNSANPKATIRNILLAVLLGFGISVYYWLPALVERQYTQASQILKSHYLDHFVSLKQLIYSRWGYGFDFPGTAKDEMSFQIGIAQWLSMIFLAVTVIILWLQKRKVEKLAAFLIFSFVFSIVMILPISKPVWEQISRYLYFDFPWRFLSLAVFAGSLAAALAIGRLKRLSWLLAIFLLLVAFYTNRNHLHVNQYVYHDDSFYINNLQTTNMFDEYRPKTIDHNYLQKRRERFEVDEQTVTIIKQVSHSNHLLVTGEANQDSRVKVNIAFYPGWKIWLNGKEQSNILSEGGVMEIKIPKGSFALETKFTNTPVRTVANFISFLSLLSLVVLTL